VDDVRPNLPICIGEKDVPTRYPVILAPQHKLRANLIVGVVMTAFRHRGYKTSRIDETIGVIRHISVKIGISSCETDRILIDESTHRRAVEACAIIVEVGRYRHTAR